MHGTVYNCDTIAVAGKPEMQFKTSNPSPFVSPSLRASPVAVCLKGLVGERGFEPPTTSRTKRRSKSKCFTWCRLGSRDPLFFSPELRRSYTEVSGSHGEITSGLPAIRQNA